MPPPVSTAPTSCLNVSYIFRSVKASDRFLLRHPGSQSRETSSLVRSSDVLPDSSDLDLAQPHPSRLARLTTTLSQTAKRAYATHVVTPPPFIDPALKNDIPMFDLTNSPAPTTRKWDTFPFDSNLNFLSGRTAAKDKATTKKPGAASTSSAIPRLVANKKNVDGQDNNGTKPGAKDVANAPTPTASVQPKGKAKAGIAPKHTTARESNLTEAMVSNVCHSSQSFLKAKVEVNRLELARLLAEREAEEAKQATLKLQFKWLESLATIQLGMPDALKPRFFTAAFKAVHEQYAKAELKVQEQVTARKNLELQLAEAEARARSLAKAAEKDATEVAAATAMQRFTDLMNATK
ncbi:hypothetical protein FRC10_006092 [Ceratobasidium sp. 414]|nr:hypothetical protein FRC10_006092 [Ceratobasidium sp. 414]